MNKHLNVTATFEKEATRDDIERVLSFALKGKSTRTIDDKGKTKFRFKVGSWCVRDLLELDKNNVFIWID